LLVETKVNPSQGGDTKPPVRGVPSSDSGVADNGVRTTRHASLGPAVPVPATMKSPCPVKDETRCELQLSPRGSAAKDAGTGVWKWVLRPS